MSAACARATCTVTARLQDVVDERKLCFEVEVREGERTIGVGTYERRVVPITRRA
jgi:fluoroacetyl-CoA thioesterase